MAIGQQTATQHQITTATVSVHPDSAALVVPANLHGKLEMGVRALKENGAELTGSSFLPRNCLLDIEFGPGDDPHHVKGMVRRIQTIDSSPTYVIWVRPPDGDQTAIEEWSAVLAASTPGTPSPTGG
ncbi:MAG: hypothetical protein GY953_14420 [bacterium]|nr:hypothetical protein [bacterium]